MSVAPRLIDAGFRALNVVHRTVVRASGGRLGRRAFGMEVIELVTTGRVTGRARSVILTVPVIEGDTLVLVASKGGDDRDPDWFRNLLTHPMVEVERRGSRRPMLTRVATPEEREVLWPRIVASFGPYDGYRRRAKREIPIVLCVPRDRA